MAPLPGLDRLGVFGAVVVEVEEDEVPAVVERDLASREIVGLRARARHGLRDSLDARREAAQRSRVRERSNRAGGVRDVREHAVDERRRLPPRTHDRAAQAVEAELDPVLLDVALSVTVLP